MSESSPTIAQPAIDSSGSWPLAARIATASGRSKPGPTLRRYAGARLTVMRSCGNTKPEFTSAALTRSRASRTALSASPTTANAGSPRRMSASTQTRRASTPSIVNVSTRARLTQNASSRWSSRTSPPASVDEDADRVEPDALEERARALR